MSLARRVAFHFSGRNRHKKWDFFMRHFRPEERLTVLDIGYSEEELSANHNYIEKHYPYQHRLTALGIDAPSRMAARYPQATFVQFAGRDFPFADQAFDIAWSNAVLEHVGDRTHQVKFVSEINRVAKSFFFTTPSAHFPVEVHTLTPLVHLLGKQVFDRYLALVGKAWATGDYMHLLNLRQLHAILHEAGVRDYSVRVNRLLGFPLEYWVYSAPCRA